MDASIIVRYGSLGYISAKREVHEILTRIGDQKSDADLLIPGSLGVKTKIDARKAITEAREIFMTDPERFRATKEWIPIDYWCDAVSSEIVKIIKEDIAHLIKNENYSIEIIKNQSAISEEDILTKSIPRIEGKVDYSARKRIHIEIFGQKVAISLLKAQDIFKVLN